MITIFQLGLWALIALLFLLILLVFAGAAFGHYSLQRAISVAANAPCPKCGSIVGRIAVLSGRERYAQKIQDMLKQHPGVKFRQIAEWEVDCPHCGFRRFYYPGSKKFETTSIFTSRVL